MALTLTNKTALVTGGSRGIGKAIAERLAAEGATVVINYARSAGQAQDLAASIVAQGGKAIALQADVSKPAEVRRLFDDAEKAVGPLDIIIANAGVFLGKPLVDSTEEDFDYVFNTNTKGVFFTLKEAAKRVRDGGRVVVVSSGGTKIYFPEASLYLGSKGAIEQFVRTLSRELGSRNVTVNTLSPGFTETDMYNQAASAVQGEQVSLGASLSPFNRIGTAEEVADVALFLASEASRWVTGQNVQAGGGVV
jgi:3-oxoacyl-[acyl-carrier protein] reductase